MRYAVPEPPQPKPPKPASATDVKRAKQYAGCRRQLPAIQVDPELILRLVARIEELEATHDA